METHAPHEHVEIGRPGENVKIFQERGGEQGVTRWQRWVGSKGFPTDVGVGRSTDEWLGGGWMEPLV